jgi:hypothetical protein
MKINTIFNDDLYYGSINSLKEECFKQEEINPFDISMENSGICFTTSALEASEVYAQPPISTDKIEDFNDILQLRKSEWYAKSEAIIAKENNIERGAPVDYNKLQFLRNKWSKESTPCVYKCKVEIQRPFIVSKEIGINIKGYSDLSEIEELIINKKYPEKVDLNKYEQSLRVVLFEELNRQRKTSMSEAIDLTKKFLNNFSSMGKRNPDKLNTFDFYIFLQDKMRENNIQASHSKIFKGINDSIIIETPKDMYANANYSNNKHVIVFDVKNILFSVSNEFNLPKNNEIINKKRRRTI